MKKKKFVSILTALILLLGGCGMPAIQVPESTEVLSETPAPDPRPVREPTKNVLYGIGEPLVQTGILSDGNTDNEAAVQYLLEAMNFGAIREWMHMTNILKSPAEVDSKRVQQYSAALDMYRNLGLEITGMSHRWFLIDANGKPKAVDGRMYRRDLTEGSLYLLSLQAIELGWKTMAQTFPQVEQWEVGNEWNTSDFLNVYPENDKPLTDEERMEIATDMMYYAYRGIKAGNPYAQVVSFSPTIAMPSFENADRSQSMLPFTNPGYGIALALNRVYANIASGSYPAGFPADTDPDHYFDLIAWHPYLFTAMNPQIVSDAYPGQGRFYREEHIDALWQNINDMAYNVMVLNGDADKKVILTEVGFNDMRDGERESAQLTEYEAMFAMISETMPYVKTVHLFRLLTASGQGGNSEAPFGLFWYNEKQDSGHTNFSPREKAYVIQKITGGTMPLSLPDDLSTRS